MEEQDRRQAVDLPEGVPPPSRPDPEAERADREHLRRIRRERQKRLTKIGVLLALVVLLIVFILANAQPVPVDFVFFTRHPRLIWVMFGCAVAGGIVGYLIARPGRGLRLHDEKSKAGTKEDPKAGA